MDTVDQGFRVVFPVLVLLIVVVVWGLAAFDVLTDRGRRECSNPLLALGIFFAPFFYGACWLVGWLAR